ncbi:MAG: pilus assembly protein [Phycisphaerales bacterium]
MTSILGNPKASKSIATYAALVALTYAALFAVFNPARAALALGLDTERYATLTFELGVFAAIGLLLAIAYRLLARQCRRAVALRRLHGAQAGSVMVEFTLVFPIVLLVMGMVVQLALFANASLVVRYAAFASARTACVTFSRSLVGIEEDLDLEPERIEETAHLILASISPRAGGNDTQARALNNIQRRQNGLWGTSTLPQRVRYARLATNLTTEDGYPPANFGFASIGNVFAPKEVTVTIRYQYLITIPGLYTLPGLSTPAPAGVSGRIITITQSVTLQTTGARESSPVSLLDGSILP